MRLAIVGSRILPDKDKIHKTKLSNVILKIIDCLNKSYHIHGFGKISTIKTGDAKGFDRLAIDIAHYRRLDIDIFKADWNKFGKSAGPIRNSQIIAHADMLIAGKTKGPENRGTNNSIMQFLHKRRDAKKIVMFETDDVVIELYFRVNSTHTSTPKQSSYTILKDLTDLKRQMKTDQL